jgi:hypothetical protein
MLLLLIPHTHTHTQRDSREKNLQRNDSCEKIVFYFCIVNFKSLEYSWFIYELISKVGLEPKPILLIRKESILTCNKNALKKFSRAAPFGIRSRVLPFFSVRLHSSFTNKMPITFANLYTITNSQYYR